jgi:hypothetical protein
VRLACLPEFDQKNQEVAPEARPIVVSGCCLLDIIDLTFSELEEDVSVFEAMLHFMYLFDYDASGRDQAPISSMIFNVKVYSIADKYDVPMLKSQAREKFEKVVKTCLIGGIETESNDNNSLELRNQVGEKLVAISTNAYESWD